MKIFNLVIMTKKKLMEEQIRCFSNGWDGSKKVEQNCTWSAINPVIHSLKELRNNTWDVERVDHAINWLRDNFEEK